MKGVDVNSNYAILQMSAAASMKAFVVIILLTTQVSYSQSLNFKNYNDNGIPTPNTYTAFQDSKGYMWFGSDRGVIRYDGYTFSTYGREDGLTDVEIFKLFEDSKGRIWFETMNGKVSYYQNGVISNSESDSTLKGMDSETMITGIEEDEKGNIWITSLGDLACYTSDKQVRRYLFDKSLGRNNLVTPRGDNTFVLATNTGFYKMHLDEVLDSFKIVKPYRAKNFSKHIYKKYQWQNKAELVFKDDHTVYKLNVATDSLEVVRRFPTGIKVLGLSKAGDELWICTTNGAIRYDMETRTAQQTTLEGMFVTAVTRDREGNYWFTTYGNGIFFCTSMGIYSYTAGNGLLANKVNCLARDEDDNLWIGYGNATDAQVSYIRNNKIHHLQFATASDLRNVETHCIDFLNDEKAILTSGGAFFVNNKSSRVLLGVYRRVAVFPEERLWISTSSSLYAMDRNRWLSFAHAPTESVVKRNVEEFRGNVGKHALYQDQSRVLAYQRVRCLFADRSGVFWISTERGLYNLHPSDSAPRKLTMSFSTPVNDIKERHDGILVMATDGDGLVFIKDGRQVASLTVQSGMSSNMCTNLEINPDGTIWAGTANGVNRITGFPDSTHVDYLSMHDGLLSNDITAVEMVKDTIWVASRKGISFFDRNYVIQKKTVPLIYIERITLDGEPVFTGKQELMVFSHRQNDIGIRYVGLLYSNGDPLLYRYKLHDADPWRYTKSTSVYLPGLNPGEYDFTVAAQGRSGQWSEEASIKFVIRNPIWKSNLFIAGVVLVMLIVVGLFVQRYVSNQRKEMHRQQRVVMSELKTLRAQMNPHFLFNALNSIQGVLLKKDIEGAQEYLIRFGKLMRLILDHSDRASITIREELDSIVNYLEIEQLRSGHQFQYRIELDGEVDIEKSEIPTMILQPFIENAIWHGFGHKKDGSELLVIRFSKGVHHIVISITDNGIGRKKAALLRKSDHKSKGLQLVKERVDILNSSNADKIELSIEDLEDADGNHPGTCVTVRIPLPG